MHFVRWTLVVKKTLALPFFLYVDFQNSDEVRSPRTCFTTHTLQNKELLLLKQWHPKIGYTSRTVNFNAFVYPVTIMIENCVLKKWMNAKKTFKGETFCFHPQQSWQQSWQTGSEVITEQHFDVSKQNLVYGPHVDEAPKYSVIWPLLVSNLITWLFLDFFNLSSLTCGSHVSLSKNSTILRIYKTFSQSEVCSDSICIVVSIYISTASIYLVNW